MALYRRPLTPLPFPGSRLAGRGGMAWRRHRKSAALGASTSSSRRSVACVHHHHFPRAIPPMRSRSVRSRTAPFIGTGIRPGGWVHRVSHQCQEIGVDIRAPFFRIWPSSSHATHSGGPEDTPCNLFCSVASFFCPLWSVWASSPRGPWTHSVEKKPRQRGASATAACTSSVPGRATWWSRSSALPSNKPPSNNLASVSALPAYT